MIKSEEMAPLTEMMETEDDTYGEPKDESEPELSSKQEEVSQHQSTSTKTRLVLLSITNVGLAFVSYLFSVSVVPAQVRALAGDKDKSLYLGLLFASGGLVAALMSPLLGTFSDRLRSRFGQRTPFMVVGTIIICTSVLGMAGSAPSLPRNCHQNNASSCYSPPGPKPLCHNATTCQLSTSKSSYGIFFVMYTVYSAGYVVLGVAWSGLAADITPEHLRGFGSGFNGMMFLLGNALGALWSVFLTDIGIWPTYVTISLLALVCSVITIVGVSEKPKVNAETLAPLTVKKALFAFWRPLKDHDFLLVFLTRFFMQMGLYTIIGYLYYFILDVINLPECMSPERATGLCNIPLLAVGGVSGAIGGCLSDRYKRRKVFVLIAGLIMAICAGGVLTWTRSATVLFISMSLTGVGYGLYVSVDFALLLDVLPEKTTRANDIAVWHQSILLPQFLATPIAGVILSHLQTVNCHIALGYRVILGISCIYFALSGLFVLMIKKVK